MKKQIISIALLLISVLVFAKNENASPVPFKAFELGNANRDTIRQLIYDNDYFNEDGSTRTPTSGVKVKGGSNSITATLFVDPNVAAPSSTPFSITIKCKYSCKTLSGSTRNDSALLSINYDPASASYKAKDFFVLPLASWASFTITKVTSSPATFTNDNNFFKLYLQYQAEKFIVPTLSQLNVPPPVIDFKPSRNNGYLKLTWEAPEPDWAERYDVEYLFVDNYDGNGGAKPAAAVPYDFRFNATRVSTLSNELEIPLVFEQGYVIARVRAIGMQGSNYDEPLYGKWDLATSSNSIPTDVKHVYQIVKANAHETDKMNWQYVGAFAGDHLHKEAVTYMDGTMRARQSVSTAHTDQNLLVGETIYDHQGRPAIQTLPAAVKPETSTASTVVGTGSGGSGLLGVGTFSGPAHIPWMDGHYELTSEFLLDLFSYKGTQPKIGFQRNFNRNSDGFQYNKNDFDTDRDGCNASPEPMSSTSGAGKYYSPSNTDMEGVNQFIPDAEGYPFVQTTYTPDKTNRASSVGKAGAELKLGSNHEQKMFYGTPSQDELDRMFGNDAGDASRYKKEMLIDENGQAHISYSDIKGNLVATALAGAAPTAYEAITQGSDANITLHLIEEDNRIDEATKSLVSQKSLLLSKTTNLNFTYRLTPPTLTGNYCNGTSFCYDCVYDLEIVVRNSCGDSVWGRKQSIGSLTPINSCSSTPVNFSGTASGLVAGNYFISKRLTVNATAVEQYVNDFRTRYVCVEPVGPYLATAGLGPGNDPCNSTCNECTQVPVDPTRRYAMTQADGSTRMVSLPVTTRAANDGNCVNYCPKKFPSPCQSALEAMRADVSPGGQYAEYTDTTRKDSVLYPRGIFNPKAFALSVLNDSANNLPMPNANWRNPLFDYQNRDGSVAYIEINEAGLPAHREIEIIVRDGKQFVKPRYLEYCADFIRYWEPQWAEALVAYHPEYGYYAWCLNHQSSYDYDTLLRVTEKYTDARAKNLIDHRVRNCANDPFFRDGLSADATAMTNSLSNFSSLPGSPTLNIEEAVYLSVNCNNVNYSAAEITACAVGRSLYTNATTADKEWSFYKDFYLQKKHKAHDAARRSWITANGYFENSQIGTNSYGVVANPLYADRVKRFVDSEDGLTYLPVDIDSVTPQTLTAWRDAAEEELKTRCGGCGTSFELTSFLNALVLEKKLKQSLVLPSVTPLAFTKRMTRYFADSLSIRYDWITNATPNSLRFTISTSRGTQCVINLNKTAVYDWDSIIAFDCFHAVSTNEFTVRGRTALDSTFTISGNSTCMNFRDCPSPRACTEEPAADEMAVLMKYLFQRARYRSTYLVLRGRAGYTPYLGAALRSYAPTATKWAWRMRSISAPDTAMLAVLEITDPTFPENPQADGQHVVQCPFALAVITPGFRLSQVADIIDISKPANATACNVYAFVLTARTAQGATFKIYGVSCYKLYDCCHPSNNTPAPSGLCCVPVMPKFDLVPTCLRDAEAVANNNRARAQDDRLTAATDSFRIKYMSHCLAAAEELNVSYSDAIYQITLMYYDRAGQLVKTVPPKGVQLLSASELGFVRNHRTNALSHEAYYPSHTLLTTYRYNSFGQLIQKNLPDEGTTSFCYDELGRAVMSQDASQLAGNACSYTLYDEFGRVLEGGRRNYSGAIPPFMQYSTFKTGLASATRTEFKRTKYDEMPATVVSRFPSPPKNLRNRVAAIESWNDLGRLSHAMYFDYDALGNTKNFIQNFKAIALSTGDENRFWKNIHYDYNPVSGKVKRVLYQKGKADQFVHWYQYDADGRMLQAQTGTNPNEIEILRETEAKYFYYPHGPLARVELGSEKIQGIDYAYTINGMLKGINSGTANKEFDMSADGKPGDATHGNFPADAFGEVLNYFSNDYKAISPSAIAFNPSTEGSVLETGFSAPLYNGFIRNTISTIPAIDSKPEARGFKYDQAGRLSEMQMIFDAGAASSNSISGSFVDDYKMKLTYDSNGNIRTLLRKKNGGNDMDNLTYELKPGNNQLDHISDLIIPETEHDLGNQSGGNYSYDACGRLISDMKGHNSMLWNNNGVIKQMTTATGNIEYGYDALGRRAWKKKGTNTDFYVRDATGNELAAYKISGGVVTCYSLGIYGVDRLGEYALNRVMEALTMDTGSFRRGLKRFEILNHIGDVQAVVTDKRKLVSGTVKADVISAMDYYPFGMPMPNRKFGDTTYRYGFQGMECDDDVYADDNEYTTDFRQYDPRVGRWMSVDPKAGKYASLSPYVAYLNNPISFSDKLGLDPITRRVLAGRAQSMFNEEADNMIGMSREDMMAHIAGRLLEGGAIEIIENPDDLDCDEARAITTREELASYLESTDHEEFNFLNEAVGLYERAQIATITEFLIRHSIDSRAARAIDRTLGRTRNTEASMGDAASSAASSMAGEFLDATPGIAAQVLGTMMTVSDRLTDVANVFGIVANLAHGNEGQAYEDGITFIAAGTASLLMTAGCHVASGGVMVFADVLGFGPSGISHAGDSYNEAMRRGMTSSQITTLSHIVVQLEALHENLVRHWDEVDREARAAGIIR